jgi:RecA/RadA recombinase
MSDSKIKLLIVDSMTAHYRVDYAGHFKFQKNKRLNKYMYMLLRTTQKNKLAVVITNQIQSNPDGDFEKSMPVGSHVMLYASTHIVHMRRLKLDNYQVELYISPCYPRKVIDLVIDLRGVVGGDGMPASLRRRI